MLSSRGVQLLDDPGLHLGVLRHRVQQEGACARRDTGHPLPCRWLVYTLPSRPWKEAQHQGETHAACMHKRPPRAPYIFYNLPTVLDANCNTRCSVMSKHSLRTSVARGVDAGEEERRDLREHLRVRQRPPRGWVLGSQQQRCKAAAPGLRRLDVHQQVADDALHPGN